MTKLTNREPSSKKRRTASPVDKSKVDNSNIDHSKSTTNASSDSGYVSTTRVEADVSSERKPSREQHETANPEVQEDLVDTTNENQSSKNKATSTSEPTKVTLVERQQEDEEVADSQEEESDKEEVKRGQVEEDDYMHELFGSYVDEDEEQVAPAE